MQEVKRGDRVSLNTQKRSYFFQDGEGGINLSEGTQEVGVIPQNSSDFHLAQINRAIKTEQLITGWPETKAEDVTNNDDDIKALLPLGRSKIEKWAKDLAADKSIKREVKNHKLETLLEMEKAAKNRAGVVLVLEQQLRYIGGISKVEEEIQEKVVIKLTSGNEEETEQP